MSTFSGIRTDRWLVFQNEQLILMQDTAAYDLPDTAAIQILKPHIIRQHLLGRLNSINIYCAELSGTASLPEPYQALPLRKALDSLGPDWYSIVTKAFTIINWDRNHQHCGRCGQPTTHKPDSFERYCSHCDLMFYPRISPSIIVLIHRDDQILMARGYHFQPGIYGLIAGFVEAGENIEDTIHREIFEETQLRVKNLRYFGSQVWPFPDSLMLGFFADYDSGELNIENDEIEDAGWYHYDNLPGRPASNLSLGSKMLNHFINEQKAKERTLR